MRYSIIISGSNQTRVMLVASSTIEGVTIRDGYSSQGGGIYASSAGTGLTLRNTRVTGNTATSAGGGIYASHSNLYLIGSEVSDNIATTGGGGIFHWRYDASKELKIVNSTISGNDVTSSSYGRGGGLYAYLNTGYYGALDAKITHSTISGNSAKEGGGLFVNQYTPGTPQYPNVHNTIIAGNTLLNGTTPSDVAGAGLDASSSYNIIGVGGTAGLINGTQGNQVGVTNLGLAPLGDYGGLTKTHALLAGSPAIDAGNPSAVAGQNGIPLNDQRGPGFSRVVDGNNAGGNRLDIGAYELEFLPIVAGIIEVVGTNLADTIIVTNSTVSINGVSYDIIASSALAVVVRGLGGNDLIDASASTNAVHLYGDGGADTLKGGSADDVLEGGADNDIIYGNGGNDRFVFGGTVSLGTDVLFESTGGGSDTLDFSTLDYGIGVNVNLQTDEVNVSNNGKSLLVDLNYAHFQIENVIGTIYNDVFWDSKTILNSTFAGGPGYDNYVFQRGYIGGGGQLIYDGHVTIIESPDQGSDTLNFSALYAPIYGITVDLLSNNPAQPIIGNFTLNLSRAAGVEGVLGTSKNDVITANGNWNWLQGGAGDDTYKFAGNIDQGHDVIFDAIGTDTIDFSGLDLGDGVVFDLRTTTNNYQVINENGKSLILDLANAQLDNLTGTRYDDTLIGNSLANAIYGGAGNDWIQGREGTDQLRGETGNDIYNLITGQTTATDVVTDADGYSIQFPNGTTSSRPFIELPETIELDGQVLGTPIAPVVIAQVSDVETALQNLTITVTGVNASDISINLNTGEILWSPDEDELGNSYQITIAVTDQQALTNTKVLDAVVVESDTVGIGSVAHLVDDGNGNFCNSLAVRS